MRRVIQASHRLSRTVAVMFAAFISVGAAADADISGTVTSADGNEAGVWVIAETSGLKTSYRKIVVTDDEGRYLLPDLPTAEYSVWVRGYGLLDSPKHAAHPGDEIDITAEVAAIAQQAAAIVEAQLEVVRQRQGAHLRGCAAQRYGDERPRGQDSAGDPDHRPVLRESQGIGGAG